MNKKLFFLALVPFAAWLFLAYSSGPPAGYTGSPGDHGHYCTSCHNQTNSYNVSIQVTSDIPASGYTPGQTYHLTLQVTTNAPRVGFEMTSEDGSHLKKGTFASVNNQTQTLSNNHYIEQTSQGTFQTSWQFNWTAPAASTGDITFYAAVNATNNNNSTSGDTPRLFNHTVHENTTAVHNGTLPGVSLYPNPLVHTLNLKGQTTVSKIVINDLTGKTIFSADRPDFPLELPSGMKKGTYLIRLETEKGSGTYRMLKE